MRLFKKHKFGLVLSGGGVRGFAHLGAIKALLENNIKPGIISGTSAGAIVGAFIADGFSPDDVMKLFKEIKLSSIVKVTLPRSGFFRLNKFKEFLDHNLRSKTFEELSIPLYVAATNYTTGHIHYFHQGSITDKLIASASVPVLFTPEQIDGHYFIDGGVVDNLPVAPIFNKCRKKIGIYVNPLAAEHDCSNLLKISERFFHIAIANEVQQNRQYFDLYIEPLELKAYSMMDLNKMEDIFKIGYDEMSQLLVNKKSLLKQIFEKL